MTFSIKLIIIVLSIRMLKLAKGFYGCKTKEMHIWNYSLYPMQVRRNAYLKLLSISHALKLLLAHSVLSKNHMLHAQQGDQSKSPASPNKCIFETTLYIPCTQAATCPSHAFKEPYASCSTRWPNDQSNLKTLPCNYLVKNNGL